MRELEQRRISNSHAAFQRLYDLYEAVRVLKPMNYFLVTDQDPDKVLEIFVRVNSEPFSTWVELAVLEDVDGLGQVTGSVWAAT